jgi:hypothetical protein
MTRTSADGSDAVDSRHHAYGVINQLIVENKRHRDDACASCGRIRARSRHSRQAVCEL